jgi:hypothetical protein
MLLASACRPQPTAAPTAAPTQPPAAEPPAGPTIFFHGDSISSGRGFGDEDYPSPLNNIYEIANILLEANCDSGAMVKGDIGQDFNQIYYNAVNGQYQSDDFILWTNAGPTVNDPAMYRKWLDLQLFATQGAAPLILTTTYDHGGFSSYNQPLAGGQSLNDAVRQFALDNDTLLLDWDQVMRQAEPRVAPYGGSLLQDGIHPGPFGNFLMAVSLLHYLGVGVSDLDNLPRLFSQQEGDVPDLTGEIFHWGYNPTRAQRERMLSGLLEDARTTIEPGPVPLECR